MNRGVRRAWVLVFLSLLAVPIGSAASDGRPEAVAVLDARFGTRTAPILLLVRPDVQNDLKLDSRRAAEAKAAIARLVERGLALKNRSGPEVAEERGRIDEEMSKWLADALSPAEIERLRQINLQWEAVSALTRPHVVELLRLNKGQQLIVDRTLRRQEAERHAKGRLLTREAARFLEEATAALSPSQRWLWNRTLGPPCRFSIGEAPSASAGPDASSAAAGKGGRAEPAAAARTDHR